MNTLSVLSVLLLLCSCIQGQYPPYYQFITTYQYADNDCQKPLSIGFQPIDTGCIPIPGPNDIGVITCDPIKQELITQNCSTDDTCTHCNTTVQKGNQCGPQDNSDLFLLFNCSATPVADLVTIPNTFVSFTVTNHGIIELFFLFLFIVFNNFFFFQKECEVNSTGDIAFLEIFYLNTCMSDNNQTGGSYYYTCPDSSALTTHMCEDAHCKNVLFCIIASLPFFFKHNYFSASPRPRTLAVTTLETSVWVPYVMCKRCLKLLLHNPIKGFLFSFFVFFLFFKKEKTTIHVFIYRTIQLIN